MVSEVRKKTDELLKAARTGSKTCAEVQTELTQLKKERGWVGCLTVLDEFDIEAAGQALEDITLEIALFGGVENE